MRSKICAPHSIGPWWRHALMFILVGFFVCCFVLYNITSSHRDKLAERLRGGAVSRNAPMMPLRTKRGFSFACKLHERRAAHSEVLKTKGTFLVLLSSFQTYSNIHNKFETPFDVIFNCEQRLSRNLIVSLLFQ